MRRMNADLIRGIRGIREYPWFICPYLLWFDLVIHSQYRRANWKNYGYSSGTDG
jgi:hypothetical protein